MADAQRVIEFLRDVRQGGLSGLPPTPEVTQMAADYAALCTQTNDRLRQCTAFLQQGLRSEAIHLAEQAPNLLDLVSQLDLPNPQVWAEYCMNNSLPVPPSLQFDRATQLNEAYAQEQPLEHLLAHHRLLALSRAPIRDRLQTLRKIAQVDTTSAHWAKDLREFETARLKELPAIFHAAVRNHDNDTLVDLMEEVNRQPWQEPPPVDLAKAVADAYARLQRAAVEEQLKKLVEPLRDAYAARSLQECQALLQRWKNTMATAGVTTIAPELMDEIKPVGSFVAEQTKREELLKRFGEVTKAFTKLLDANAPDAALEAGYARLKQFKEEIPEELVRRYMAKKTDRRKEVDRRHKTRLIMIGGVVAAIVAVALIGAWIYMTAANAEQWATRINEAVARHTKEGMDEGQGIVDKLKQTNAGLLSQGKVAAAVIKLQEQKAQYARDQESIVGLMARLAAAQDSTEKSLGVKSNDDVVRSQAQQLDDTLKDSTAKARDLAWADAHEDLSKNLAAATVTLKSAQERILGTLRKELGDIQAALDAIPASTSDAEAAKRAQSQLAALDTRAGALANFPLLDDAARSSLKELTTRLAQRRQGAVASGDVAQALQQVRGATSSAAALKSAIDTFVARYPQDAHTAEFKKALENIPAAQSLEAWLQFIAPLKGSLAPASIQAATKRAADVETFLTAHADLPATAEATSYAEYLHAAADAMADKGTWQNSFSGLLANPLLTELQVMDISDGRHFYTLGDAKRTEHRFNNVISYSFEAIDPKELTKDISKRLTVTVEPPLAISEKPVPAPHAKVMADIADDLKRIGEKNWDTFGIDTTDRLINNAQMDVVVKAILVQQLLKTELSVAGGDYGVGDIYERTLSDLSRQNPSEIYWFDPSRVTEGNKRSLAAIVSSVPSAASARQRLAAGRAALFKALRPDGMTAGIVMKNDAGGWNVYTGAAPGTGATLWAIVTVSGTPGAKKLQQVGVADGNRFVLNDAELNKLPQGSIVYAAPGAS